MINIINIINKIYSFFFIFILRLKGVKVGKNCYVGISADLLKVKLNHVILGNDVVIGAHGYVQTIDNIKTDPLIIINNGTNIGRQVTISCIKKVSIGKDCLLGYGVSILDHDHELYSIDVSPTVSGLTQGKSIIIEDDCFVGAHSFILKGVHLGKHCVVGANSVVTKSFPPYSVIAGNPARIIKRLKNT